MKSHEAATMWAPAMVQQQIKACCQAPCTSPLWSDINETLPVLWDADLAKGSYRRNICERWVEAAHVKSTQAAITLKAWGLIMRLTADLARLILVILICILLHPLQPYEDETFVAEPT